MVDQSPPLDGIRIVDVTQGVGGPFASMLLGDMGADVLKVEPPAGDRLRGEPAFHVLNRGKQSIVLDVTQTADRAELQRLIAEADIFLHDWLPGEDKRLGFEAAALLDARPELIIGWLPPYGGRGPHADLPADEGMMQAVAGIQDAQFRYDDPPVFVNLPVAGYAQGLLSANAAVASLFARARSGRGDRFEVSGVSALVFMETISYIRAENVARLAGHAGPRGGIPTYRLVRGSDDWLFVGALTAPFWTNLAVAAGLEDCLIDERFHHAPMGVADMDARRELARRVDEAFATKSRDEWLRILEAANVPRAPALTREEFVADPQVRHNNMLAEVDDAVLGPTRQMRLPVELRDTPGRVRSGAPLLGAHGARRAEQRATSDSPAQSAASSTGRAPSANVAPPPAPNVAQPPAPNVVQPPSDNVAQPSSANVTQPLSANVAQPSSADVAQPSSADVAQPPSAVHPPQDRPVLDGITVLDLSGFIAGANCPALLADMGANVIKVEGPDGDAWRAAGLAFLGSNRGKRGIVIDLKRDAGRDLLLDMVDRADVVVDNVRAGVMDRLGIGWDVLHARNPRLIHTSVTGYGPTGPYAHLPGFDPLFQARSGLMRAQGEPGGEPVYLQVAVCDYGTALSAAYGTLLALFARERTRRGQRVETSLLHSAFTMQAGEFIFYEGRPGDVPGARDMRGRSALYRIYEAADGSLMLSCSTHAHAGEMRDALGMPMLLDDPAAALSAPADSALAATIADRIAEQPVAHWLKRFRQCGIPAAPCTRVGDLFEDAHLQANDLWWDCEHPKWGHIRQPGATVRWDAQPMRIERRAPLLGEHTTEVLREFGFPDDRIATLHAAGVIHTA